MTLDELRNGVPPMPESCRDALAQTLRTLDDAPRTPAPRWPLVPLIAALLTLALAGASLAAATPQILRWLLGPDSPNEALERLAQPLKQSAAADGIAVTLTGAVCDGRQLSLSWQIGNAEPSHPALVYLKAATLDGRDILLLEPDDARLDARWSPSFHLDTLPAARNPLAEGTTLLLPEPPAEGSSVRLSFAVLRPRRALVVVDAQMHEDLSALGEDERREMEDARQTLLGFEGLSVAPAGDLDAGAWLSRGFLPIDASGQVLLPDVCEDGAFDSLFEETAVLSVAFSPAASPQDVLDLAPDAALPIEGGSAVLDALVLSPLSTHLALRLIPEENTRKGAQALLCAFGSVALCDGSGAPLRYLAMDFLSSGEGHVQQQDGQWLCLYSLDLPGLRETPETVQVRMTGNGEVIFAGKPAP